MPSGSRERRLYFKYCAKNAMRERGNLLRFVGAFLVLLAIAQAFRHFFETVCFFVGAGVTVPLIAAELLLIFIITAPVFVGLLRMAHKMVSGEHTELSDLFSECRSDRIRNAYEIALICIFDLFAMLGLSFAFGRCIAYAFEGMYAELFSPLACGISTAVIPFTSGIFQKAFVLPAAYFEFADLETALKVSKKNRRGLSFEISAFNVSFIPLVLLSVLTLGIVFFVYLLPLYMLSWQICASYFVGSTDFENYRK
ncbi:MAG: hypothetical protein IJ303_05285 [Clostridia bacterium]|nr:hypothetical protein [Clostridia bacterium]